MPTTQQVSLPLSSNHSDDISARQLEHLNYKHTQSPHTENDYAITGGDVHSFGHWQRRCKWLDKSGLIIANTIGDEMQIASWEL
jgi:hypothetical protein